MGVAWCCFNTKPGAARDGAGSAALARAACLGEGRPVYVRASLGGARAQGGQDNNFSVCGHKKASVRN